MDTSSDPTVEPERPFRATTNLSEAEMAHVKQVGRQFGLTTVSACLRALVIKDMERQQQGHDD